MAKVVGIGKQRFDKIVENNCFCIDKTMFIKEWWENQDDVTLITRPRRFGKTLNMDMVKCFFSVDYKNRGDLFEKFDIWKEEKYRELQGTYPVIFLSFADIKQNNYNDAVEKMKRIICLTILVVIIKNVIILLDEYDTPMQEAYINGYWEKIVTFTRGFFNSTFKTNPYLERAIMTGITTAEYSAIMKFAMQTSNGSALAETMSKESIFSDLNNLVVVTTTSNRYETSFGFKEEEVFSALDEHGFSDKKEEVKRWYDGFSFGNKKDIYNPWSIINFLKTGEFAAYWADSSSNGLINSLVQKGSPYIKIMMETLLQGGKIETTIDEQVVFSELDYSEDAVWSLMLASGYLKVISAEPLLGNRRKARRYNLALTNLEIQFMFENMILRWFSPAKMETNEFVKALINGDVEAMNNYMNDVALKTFSSFDTGKHMSEKKAPENFFHGFVLGLMVDQTEHYIINSNRESGYGRYDIMLEPVDKNNAEYPAIIIEFKVINKHKEDSLEETVQAALKQIEEKKYDIELIKRGVKKENIRHYGFAFRGREVLIG